MKRIDLWNARDFRAALREGVTALETGAMIGLPTESGYLPCQLPPQNPVEPLGGQFLCFSLETALPWCDPVSATVQRWLSKWWPGAVVVDLPCTGQTEREIARKSAQDGRIRLRVADDEMTAALLRMIGDVLYSPHDSAAAPFFPNAGSISSACPELALVLDAGPVRYRNSASQIRVDENHWSLAHQGVWNERMLARMTANLVLFVCTGNTCRSPMAEVLFRKQLTDRLQCSDAELLDRGFAVLSAGLSAVPGMSASPEAVELLRAEGISLEDHESQFASEELLRRADWIIAMTNSHRRAILEMAPELTDRVRLLSPEGRDISDPIGGTTEDYRRCRNEIARLLTEQLEQFIRA